MNGGQFQSLDPNTSHKYQTIIVGGGITGTATAYYLSRESSDIALIDQFDLNTQASGRNAGSLHGQIQFESFHKMGLQWAKEFLPALTFLADSLELWDSLSDELNADLEVVKNGGLMVAETLQDMRRLETKVVLENSVGINSSILSSQELSRLAPYISQKMKGAAYCPIEGKANPLITAPAFAKAARKNGVVIHSGVEAVRIEKCHYGYRIVTSAGTFSCERLVLTANAGLSRLTSQLSVNLPISNEPVQVSVSEQLEPFVKHLIYFTTEKLTLKQAKSGSLLIGGGWPAKINEKGIPVLNPESLRANLKVAVKVVPSISKVKLIRTWIGVGNGTLDQRPIIGELQRSPGCYVGMFPYMGFTAGPLVGQVLSELILTGVSTRDLSAFRPERFTT
jgi:sarcosine oxidase subunit beta